MSKRSPIRLAAALALAAAALPAGAAEVAGTARIIDGDTLEIDGTRIRLVGIDAPERHQTCGAAAAGAVWDCGVAAAARLTELGRGTVHCSGNERDRYGRLLATCSVEGEDIGGRLVSEGLARAYVHFSDAYLPDEARARSRHAGLWQGASEAPWDYRANPFEPAAGYRRRLGARPRRIPRRPGRLRDQGQHQRQGRAHLPPARRARLRPHPHRPRPRRGLVLRRSRRPGRRLPPRRRPLTLRPCPGAPEPEGNACVARFGRLERASAEGEGGAACADARNRDAAARLAR